MILVNSAYYSSIVIFLAGLVLKFYRTPFHTVILLIAIAGFLISGIIYLVSSSKEKGLFALVAFSLSTALLSVMKFWPFPVVITFVLLALVLIVIIIRSNFNILDLRSLFPGFILLLIISFGSMSKSDRYHFISLKFNKHSDQDYFTWDKYAWFLNVDGKAQESMEALIIAKTIANDKNQVDALKMIQSQIKMLEESKWERFR